MPQVKQGVIGVLGSSGRVLMVRRASGIAKAGCWCFPGGHVEPGETLRDALTREMSEELGIKCETGRHLGAIRVQGGYVLDAFLTTCTDLRLQPAPAEIADTCWVRHDEIERIAPGLPSNAEVARLLQDHLSVLRSG